MKKYCIIKQPAGFGDVLFCQKIAKVFQENTEYKEIIWIQLLLCILLFKNIWEMRIFIFLGKMRIFLLKRCMNLIVTVVYSLISSCSFLCRLLTTRFHPAHVMVVAESHGHIKYNFCNVDYLDWKDYLAFRRFEDREDALVEHLGLDLNEPYNLINKSCGTPPRCEYRENIKPDNDYKNIYMDPIEGFSLFDWCKVFEHAQEIHTMETGVWYVLDKLGLENVYIYSKYTSDWNPEKHLPDDFSYMKDNCNPNWKLIN